MKYTILIYQAPEDFAARTDPEKSEAFWATFIPYMKAIRDAGVFVDGAGLEPPEDTKVVAFRDGRRLVQDGPYADTKEQIGGLIVIDVPDLDTALDWAARCPVGSVEVRPNVRPAG